jgi:TatA/E family protein of Tat protein translocase
MSSMFAFLGAQEVVVILAIALLVFGPARLPEIGRQIAMAMREMRKMSNDVQSALNLHEYDSRYEGGSAYDTSGSTDSRGGGSPSWTSGDYSEPPVNTRPWSIADAEEGGVAPAVTTVEPPGPPALRRSSETSQT